MQMRFLIHLATITVELLCVAPAFLTHSGPPARVLATTVTTFGLSAVVGYLLDMSTRQVPVLCDPKVVCVCVCVCVVCSVRGQTDIVSGFSSSQLRLVSCELRTPTHQSDGAYNHTAHVVVGRVLHWGMGRAKQPMIVPHALCRRVFLRTPTHTSGGALTTTRMCCAGACSCAAPPLPRC